MVTKTEQQENELICEKLLGWVKIQHRIRAYWQLPNGKEHHTDAPCFTTGTEVGPILEKLCELNLDPGFVKDPHGRGYACSLEGFPEDFLQPYRTIWEATRAAALQYLDSKR